jgi:hypothetical protein
MLMMLLANSLAVLALQRFVDLVSFGLADRHDQFHSPKSSTPGATHRSADGEASITHRREEVSQCSPALHAPFTIRSPDGVRFVNLTWETAGARRSMRRQGN